MKTINGIIFFMFTITICLGQIDTSKWEIMIYGADTLLGAKPNKGDKFLKMGEYKLAIIEYEKLHANDNNNLDYYYNIATVYSLLNKKDSAFKYLFESTLRDSSISVLTDPNFFNIITDKRWELFENEQIRKAKIKSSFTFKNENDIKSLLRMQIKDQAFYSQIEINEQAYGIKNRINDSLWSIKKILNKQNLSDLNKLLKKRKWINKSEFGNTAASTAFLIIQHSNLKTQLKYLIPIEKACNKCEADWEEFAMLKDRVLLHQKKPQIYGTQVVFNKITNKYELYKVNDLKNIDKIRASVNLPPLKDYLSQLDIEFNDNSIK